MIRDFSIRQTLDQPCWLCGQSPVVYVKTKEGFKKVCLSCEESMKRDGLLVKPEVIRLAREFHI